LPYRFFGKRYSKFIFLIKDGKNIQEYSREVDMTTNHLSGVTDHWEALGVIKKIKNGREIEIRLTERGKEWAQLIRDFDEFATAQINRVQKKV
jgi:DNA-binding MarR family transcriptional regulator